MTDNPELTQLASLEDELVYLPTDAFAPNEYNPNRQSEHDFELLLKSMEEDGFTQPILALKEKTDTGKHVIVDGEHRWRAAQVLELATIPAVLVEMSEAQRRVSTIRHNRARGMHDMSLEAQVLRELKDMGALDRAADALLLTEVDVDMLKSVPSTDELAGVGTSEMVAAGEFTEEEQDLIQRGVQIQVRESEGGETVAAMSVQAAEATRRRERLLDRARGLEESSMGKRDDRIYRLSLIFADDEASVVRETVGDQPAESVLALCRSAQARGDLAE